MLNVTGAVLSTVLDERASLSPEMALRSEKAFGVSKDTHTQMQNCYGIAEVRGRGSEIAVAGLERKAHGNNPRAALQSGN